MNEAERQKLQDLWDAHHERGLTIDEIREYYALLSIPFDQQYLAEENVSAALSVHTKALLLQNDAFLSTGATVVEAFDRLEVAEFTAKALASLPAIGDGGSIEKTELEALVSRFLS